MSRASLYSSPTEGMVIYRQIPRLPGVGQFFRNVTKSAFSSAVVYGVSAAFPPIGAFAIPAYTVYGYAKFGLTLWRIQRDLVSGSPSAKHALDATGSGTEILASNSSDAIASAMVDQARRSGLFREVVSKTGVSDMVVTTMMKGSISSALSTGSGEFAKFAVSKMVGA